MALMARVSSASLVLLAAASAIGTGGSDIHVALDRTAAQEVVTVSHRGTDPPDAAPLPPVAAIQIAMLTPHEPPHEQAHPHPHQPRPPTTSITTTAAVAAAAAVGPAGAAVPSDCSLAGSWDPGAGCQCEPGWTGATCGLLRFAEAPPPQLNGFRAPNGSTTWGGSPIQADDRKTWVVFCHKTQPPPSPPSPRQAVGERAPCAPILCNLWAMV